MPHSSHDNISPMPPMDAPSMDAPNGMPQGDETDMGNGGMNNEEPPLGDDGGMGNDASPMGDDGSTPEESEGNGVGKDVREYSGKLSQALNDYNQENPDDDERLNKYAINMIAAQVADNLSDRDKRNVIKKLKGIGDDDEPNDNIEGDDGMDNGIEPDVDAKGEDGMTDNGSMNARGNKGNDLQLESYISEIVSDILSSERHTRRGERKVTNKKVSRKNPFVSKR